ncbi:IPT/TIG domain-containing protein [Flaviramulus sp. BrNp1-15]|uniref:WD40/YVTN/BNR-like repeat-containing protein n=1 Tax=Flaviramulus sp. BrNp1-15 TaxID=2916754 RepID=UPI001EE92AC4|nr:IPT/TIG domain-containing protein [Flaviramulus sp. BrNp1-15]ULC58174.1 IPT/TIG domain-containing protein [Flaviramulus sp. BrNp1-15]
MKKLLYILSLLTLIYSCDSSTDIKEKNPFITEVSPNIFEAGSEVLINGTDLDNNPTLLFNGEVLLLTMVTDNYIAFNIPENASSGLLSIEFDQSESNTEVYLKILDPEWEATETDNYTQLEFVSNTTGFAIKIDNSVSMSRIDKTVDGGKTWTTIFQEDVADFFFSAVNTNTVYAKGNLNTFKKTIDGGNTWENFTVLDVSFLISNLFFINESEGFLLADKLGNTHVFKTIDAGNTWEETLMLNVPTFKIEIAQKNENEILFLNKEANEIIKTTDNGENWTTQNLNISIENSLLSYSFDSEKSWLSLTQLIGNTGGLYYTTNMENGWETNEIPSLSTTNESINKIIFFDSLKGVVITNNGGVLYTEDGGEAWKLLYIGISEVITSNYYENTVYIISNGHLHKKQI